MRGLQHQPLRQKSGLQRLFRQEVKENALIALNNLLVTKAPMMLTVQDIQSIENQYRLKLSQSFALNLQELWAVRWNEWLKSGESDAPIQDELDHLAALFGIADSTTAKIIQLVADSWYQKAVSTVLQKRVVTANDETVLESLRVRARMNPESAVRQFEEAKLKLLAETAKPIIQKQLLSPADETKIRDLSAALRLRPKALQPLSNQLLIYKTYWQLENLDLPVGPAEAALQKSEQCHFKLGQVKWLETRSAGRGYSQLEQVNYGTVYLTNKRLFLEGSGKNSSLPYERIRGFRNLKEGLELQKDKGKDPVLQSGGDMTAFQIILKRLCRK